MSRQARLKSSTGIYHIMIRGINKEKIFLHEVNKLKLLDIIKEIKKEIDFSIIAYCIMDNHLHLLLKADDDVLAVIMKKINVKYAMYYNRIKERYGYVFQNRFRSEVVENERYLLGVLRYIHNNPVNAYITNDLKNYKWSSINDYLNDNPGILCGKYIDIILDFFRNKNEFIEFHKLFDNNIYVDTIEEETININNIVQKSIEDFIFRNGIIDNKDLTQFHKEEICKILLNLNLITYSQIADLCNLSLNKVKEISKDIKKLTNP